MGKEKEKFAGLLAKLSSMNHEFGIYIFGTGAGDRNLLEALKDYRCSTGIPCSVKGFFDNNPAKHGLEIEDVKIIMPQGQVVGEQDYVFIASFDYAPAMRQQLLALGLDERRMIDPQEYLGDLLPMDCGKTDHFKYDIKLDVDRVTSQTLILSQIKPGSSVLEFGTSTGYMTKYLKEELRCHVTGIEIVEAAALQASLYADKMIVADLDALSWVEELENKKFDYIIFADVLEHLQNPYAVFHKAVKFLADGGQVIVSVPNIAHNAIIMDLMENKFNYHSTGLLDNTHIFFFTENTVKNLFDSNGLEILTWEKISLAPQDTEFGQEYDRFPVAVKEFLLQRTTGHTYQFVVTARSRIDLLRKKKIIFFGTGSMSQKIMKSFPLPVIYFVDNNSAKWNQAIGDIMVYSPMKLMQEEKEHIAIILATEYYSEIARQLKAMGFTENVHFYDGYFFSELT